ncbi:hypothetical protein [Chitinilyticum piscinae]|uniref:Uncharacterized protein n=1 Tax=Chitinilyticum piscinae TaxID=2866724 RepID=A0A8J7K296_9NEIS|nr:hypothetical protein [Chitinilyticum piscinae]MBE9610256.1 hypothetical protein [Chitinilyticum piscinae]
MTAPGFFVDVVLPACVSTALGGFFLMLILSRLLYDYVERNYCTLFERTQSQTWWVDQDQAMAFVGDIWALTRSGRYRRIDSTAIRLLFGINAIIGALTISALAVLALGFLGVI